MNPPCHPPAADAPAPVPALEAFMAAFLCGSGRTAEAYADSWAATVFPLAPPTESEGPERALG